MKISVKNEGKNKGCQTKSRRIYHQSPALQEIINKKFFGIRKMMLSRNLDLCKRMMGTPQGNETDPWYIQRG